MNFIRKFGIGLLYALLFPLIAAVVVVIAVFSIPNFFVQLVKMIISFFKGDKLFPPFEEDIEAEAIIARQLAKENSIEDEPTPTNNNSNVYVQTNYYSGMNPNGMPSPNGAPQQVPPYNQGYPGYQNPYGQVPPNQALYNQPSQPYGQVPSAQTPQQISNPEINQISTSTPSEEKVAEPIEVDTSLGGDDDDII